MSHQRSNHLWAEQVKELEVEVFPVLEELTSSISTLNLEHVRRLKSDLLALTRRVQKVCINPSSSTFVKHLCVFFSFCVRVIYIYVLESTILRKFFPVHMLMLHETCAAVLTKYQLKFDCSICLLSILNMDYWEQSIIVIHLWPTRDGTPLFLPVPLLLQMNGLDLEHVPVGIFPWISSSPIFEIYPFGIIGFF